MKTRSENGNVQTRTGIFVPPIRRVVYGALAVAAAPRTGIQGFKMLVVLQNEEILNRFMKNQLSGSISAVVVVVDDGMSAKAPFQNGVAIYQGASAGLMAGINIGLDYMRYQPLTHDS